MKVSPLLLVLLITVFVMGLIHYLALEFFLYWQYPWLDVPMHVLGGVIVAFAVLILPGIGFAIPKRYLALGPILAFVLMVGLLWELFEIWADIPLFEDDFGKDIIKDLLMDIFGGVVGYYVGTRINSLEYV